jgi:hypothetical protein
MNKACSCAFCKKPNWISKEDFIIETSKFLGYPKCCAKAFADDIINLRSHDHDRMKAYYKIKRQLTSEEEKKRHSFIPCLKHSYKIVNENKNFRRIIRNRICTTPFPYASIDEFKKYLKTIKKNYENRRPLCCG